MGGFAAWTQQTTFRTAVDIVQVDVSVLDGQRQPVRDLAAEDFTLLEDGETRPIVAFSQLQLPHRPAMQEAQWTRDLSPAASTNELAQEGRLVVIMLDRTIPNGYPLLNARELAKAAVRELGPGDLAAVVYTGAGTPQDFTADRAALFAAIDGNNPASELSAGANAAWASLLGELENSEAISNPGLEALNFSSECPCGACVAQAIGRIADAVREVPRWRKLLLFIGTDINLETQAPICIDPVRKAREAMFRSLDLASLTVHALDPSGLNGPTYDASRRVGEYSGRATLARQGNISVLADRTGGRTVLNTNDPHLRVPQIFRESDVYYLLGFPPASTDGRQHHIAVTVNRPGTSVYTRRVFIAAPPPEPRPPDTFATEASADSAIRGILPTSEGVSLEASAMVTHAAATSEPVVAISLHVRHDSSNFAGDAHGPEAVDISTGIFTANGRHVGTLRPHAGGSATQRQATASGRARPGRDGAHAARRDRRITRQHVPGYARHGRRKRHDPRHR